MKELTTKQQREFWELCGLTRKKKGRFTYWYNSNDILEAVFIPPIDLNSLFKYAPDYQQIIFQPGYCGITIDDKLYEGSGDTEVDALYWAISSALGGKK